VSLQPTNQSFDDLAKGLASGTLSMGKALRWMGGALLGAALASVPGVAWADGCRRLGRECRRDSQCCSRNCIRRRGDKVCGCPEDQSRCGDRCVNLKTDERHCGRCGKSCDAGEECVRGKCKNGTPTCTVDSNTPCSTPCNPSDPACQCATTVEGDTVCLNAFAFENGQVPGPACSPALRPCTSSADCPDPEGQACVSWSPCCPAGQVEGAVCMPLCGFV
jgi:hypothetical protein